MNSPVLRVGSCLVAETATFVDKTLHGRIQVLLIPKHNFAVHLICKGHRLGPIKKYYIFLSSS